MAKYNKLTEKDISQPLSIEKVANANTVIGDPIITNSGMQIIPLTSITIVNLNGGGEYGDTKTFQTADGFKLAGGNGTVINVKPKGFLIDDGKECKLLKVDEEAVETLVNRTEDLVKFFRHA